MPTAIASTFFTAPPTSTPITSSRGVDAQGLAVQRLHGRLAKRRLGAGDDERGGLAARHLDREARARQHAHALQPGCTARATSWPRRPLPCSKPLQSHSTPGASAPCVGSRRNISRKAGHRRGDDRQPAARMRERGVEVGRDRQRGRQRHAVEIARVDPRVAHLRAAAIRSRVHSTVGWRAADAHGQRAAPGTGAEDIAIGSSAEARRRGGPAALRPR